MPETVVTESDGDRHEEYDKFKRSLFDAIKGAENICLDETQPDDTEALSEGITGLMGACQQGLEHDVRSILRRYNQAL